MVNHTENFVDYNTNTHTQTIESLWASCKRKIKYGKGIRRDKLQLYLDEFCWKRRFIPNKTSALFFVARCVARYWHVTQ